jgi:two-component system chemotaxis response regulator CheB
LITKLINGEVALMIKKIKVLIVDDSMFFRTLLVDKLSKHEGLEVIGYAVNAFDAKEKIPLLKPDVVTLDVEMPKLNGIEFLKQLLPIYSVPVVLVSSVNINVFDALSAGAVDFVKKPDISRPGNLSIFLAELVSKIKIASNAQLHTIKNTTLPKKHNFQQITKTSFSANNTIIAIGASTGGTEATLTVLRDLPKDIPGIVIVQHMPPVFTRMYAERLNRICEIDVKEAEDGDVVRKGLALIAPGDFQMALSKLGTNYVVKCYKADKVSGHRPSVDVLFTSVAEVAGKNAIGVILTGMGKDGADGLLKMRKQGAYTIGQDKESCVVYGMPMVAYNIGAVNVQASCENIASVIQKHLSEI